MRRRSRVIPVESGRALDAMSVDDERAIETGAKQGVATQNTTTTMTNDNNTRTKANAVFFAAVMVISMVAVGFAAAPAAALSDTGSDGISTNVTTVGEDATHSFNVTVDSNDAVIGQNLDEVDVDYGAFSDTGSPFANVGQSDITVRQNGTALTVDAAPSGNPGTISVSDGNQIDVGTTIEVEIDGVVNPTSAETKDVSVTVRDGGTPNTVTSNLALALESPQLTVEPSSDTIGDDNTDSANYVVTVTDSNGNPINGLSVAAADSGTATVSTTSPATTDSNGEATFTYTASVAGSQTLTFTEQVTATTTATSVTATLDVVDTSSASFAVDGNSQNIYYQGQEITISNLVPNEDYELRSADSFTTTSPAGNAEGTSFEDAFNTDDNGEFTLDTEGLESDFYYITGPGLGGSTDEENSFELTTQDLDTEFDEDSVQTDENGTLEISSNRGTYTLNVSANSDLDDDQLTQLFSEDFTVVDSTADDDEIQLTGVSDGTKNANFTNVSDLSAGDYEFTFSVSDTSAEDVASINVTEAGEGDIQLAQGTYETAQGDVANVTVELSETTTGTVVIGNFANDNYQANITVTDGNDDGVVNVQFNTYTAGQTSGSASDVVSAEAGDDSATLQNYNTGNNYQDLSSILDTGDYDISVSPTAINGADATAALNDESDIGSLVISERSTDSMQLWRVSGSTAGDVADALDDGEEDAASAIVSGVENGAVTQTDTIALSATNQPSDVLVHQISASGLEGALASTGQSSSTDALHALLTNDYNTFDENDSLSLTLEEQDAGANQQPQTIDVSDAYNNDQNGFSDVFTVIYDETNDDYYVILDADELNTDLGNNANLDQIADDDEYEIEFAVQDARLLENLDSLPANDNDEAAYEDAFESVNATVGFEEATGEFDLDPVEVGNSGNQSISGTTNIAPGSEFSVRVRSDDAQTNFIKNTEGVTVQPDGTFSGSFDFSEESVNDTFTVQVRNTLFTVEADGSVVEGQTSAPANFAVSDLSPAEATATAGDSVTVSATIENTGGQEATQSVALTLDGDELDSQDVTLADGNSTTVEFTADTSGLEAGDYTHGVATDDDEATGTLTIETSGGDDGGDDSSGDDSSGDGSSEDGTPGFGALVALVALIAAALLATRRND